MSLGFVMKWHYTTMCLKAMFPADIPYMFRIYSVNKPS